MKIALFDFDNDEFQETYSINLKHHQLTFFSNPLNLANLPDERDFEIISLRSKSQASKEVLENFPNLKFIALRITGFDNVDLNYAKSKEIIVSNVPAYGSETVAEFAFGLILSLSRHIPEAYLRTHTERKFSYQGLKGFNLNGKTIGVIGTGKIGANVIQMAKGFDMKVLAYDVIVNKDLAQKYDFSYVILEDLLKQSDVITIHCPSTPETHHLINMNNISQIKRGSILVNTARGEIVELQALVAALRNNILSRVGLDVLEGEKKLNSEIGDLSAEELEEVKLSQELMGMENVIITPHMAFYTKEAEEAITQTTIDNINHFTDGLPQNVVNSE